MLNLHRHESNEFIYRIDVLAADVFPHAHWSIFAKKQSIFWRLSTGCNSAVSV